MTEVRKKIENPSGLRFEISETDCSAMAHTSSVSVFVSETGASGRDLLFKFDPVDYDYDALPGITVTYDDHIEIRIASLDDIDLQEREWRKYKIDYFIGHINYPK